MSEDIRLTHQQIAALRSADFHKPIYGENPRFSNAQMPEGMQCFVLRTLESLVKRGYLVANKSGGYLLTTDGQMAAINAVVY